jgi:DcmR-like sensory protein/histidine kinase-like protein
MECSTAPVDHYVWFYEERSHLIGKVAEFAADGLRAGEQVILIATREHLRDVEDQLALADVRTAHLQAFDATDALHTFYRDGVIDRQAFDDSIGALVRAAAAKGPVRAFGEMVALLWADGAVREAIELEAMWCELRALESFSLLCAYPSSIVLDEPLHAPVNAVCALHSEIRIGEGGEPTSSTRIYPGTLEAVRDARRFVRNCMGDRGDGLEDALLVTSELSCNAVRHARTGFAVHVVLLDDRMRIGVRDANPVAPRLLPMTRTSESGRGIATIAALSTRWWIEPDPVGKTVWAELPF